MTNSPSRSLLRTEAEERHALLDITSYDVRLDLASDEATFASTTTIRFTSRGGTTWVDVKPVEHHEATLDGVRIDPVLLDRGRLPLETTAGEHELTVTATMRVRNDGEGLHRSIDPADGQHYVYGMSFLDAAPSIFACFDQPDLKAPYTFHVRAPRGWTVRANAAGSEVEPGVWEFEQSQPLSTYFVTLVAGPFHLQADEHDGIPLLVAARSSLADVLDRDAEELLTITKQCFDEFHRLFGIRYPFGKYDQMFVPEFNAGAMENPGCVTFRDPMLFTSRATRGALVNRATTIAHEMAHQWFGNIVTPRWWDDLWLNESFAEYMGNRVTADVTAYDDAWANQSWARRQWGLVADQAPSTHPVAGNGAVDAAAALQDFDGISYAKGSAILRQLNASLGDEVFFASVIDHFTRHRVGIATMQDLLGSWERAGAGDLSGFVTGWLRAPGPDRIELDRTAGVLRRTAPAAHPAERAHTFRVAVGRPSGWEVESVTVDSDQVPFSCGEGAVLLDPYDDTWALPMADALTVEALRDLLPTTTDPGLVAGAWNNIRNAFHNAAIDPAAVVDLAEVALPLDDAEDGPRRTRNWLLGPVVQLGPTDAGERIHRAAVAALELSESGSERQLSAFRTAVSSASNEGVLRGWLAETPEGIELDTSLRWRILVQLAALGATELAELQAAYDADPTAEARVALARARASLPTPEAKAWAWEVFTGAVDLPNYEIQAAGEGMWRTGQEELTDAYVERYFSDLPGTVAVRSGWALADAAGAFFPSGSLDAGTVERATALAADESLDPGLRRRLADCADLLARRLAVRAAFPQA